MAWLPLKTTDPGEEPVTDQQKEATMWQYEIVILFIYIRHVACYLTEEPQRVRAWEVGNK